jgi:hypothetical protein
MGASDKTHLIDNSLYVSNHHQFCEQCYTEIKYFICYKICNIKTVIPEIIRNSTCTHLHICIQSTDMASHLLRIDNVKPAFLSMKS